MSWTVLPYEVATGGSVSDLDMTAVADPEFTTRNSHFIFTEPYNLAALVAMGATITRANVQVPTFNAFGRWNVWPVMLSSAKILSPPRVMWLPKPQPPVPTNEEFTIKVTDGASENAAAFVFLMTPQHNRNLPQTDLVIPVRCTATITQVANGWSAQSALVFEQTLRGGVYSILSAECVGVNSALFRLNFPRARAYHGRKMRPGWLCQDVIGDLPEARLHIDPYYMGEWGRFHTFEPPQVEVYGIAASASVGFEFRLWLAYLGTDVGSNLDSWVSQGAA